MQELWDKIWKDKKGHVIIWQMPNRYLIGWAGFSVVSLMFNERSAAANIFSWAASAALIYWSFLEIYKGVNYFRRVLGFVVLIFALMSLIKSI